MRDPHVEWLEYEMQTKWLFTDPPALDWDTGLFQAKLDHGILRVKLRKHFATEAAARAAVDFFLLTWEVDVALTHGRKEVTFAFKQSHVVDRDPPPPSQPGIARITGVMAVTLASVKVSATGQVIRKSYPAVPSNFVAAPDVVTLWNRYEGYQKGREPLASMAYFCFTMLTNSHGGTDAARKTLAVDHDVLRKVSELSTNRGEASTARKMTNQLTRMTETEARWLDAAIRALIRRVGEIATGHSPSQLTMKQLPPL